MTQWKKNSGIKRLILAFSYSMHGIRSAYQGEAAFRQESWFAFIAIGLAIFLPVSLGWKTGMIGVVLLVLLVELLNSAIEAIVDRISIEIHPLSKNAKDYGSAAVLMTLLIAAVVWGAALVDTYC